MKKIIVTENQAKLIVDYIIGHEETIDEQKVLATTTETKPSKVYNISNSFASGQYKLTNTKEIVAAMGAINKEIAGYPDNQKFIINVESSESAVPPPAGMSVGDLSRLRGEAVETFLRNGKYIDDKVQINKIDKGVQGPAWSTTKGKDAEEYKKNQYVTLSLQVIGSKTVQTICNFTENKVGGVARKEDDFVGYSKTIDISKLPDGTKFKIVFSPRQMADMLVVNAGSFNQSTGLASSSPGSPMINSAVATALYYGYNGSIPKHFPQNIVQLDKYDAAEIYKNNTVLEGFKVMWGHVMDPQFFNWSKDIFLNSVKLYTFSDQVIKQTTTDDPDFKELNPNNDGSVGITVTKDSTMSSVTMRVYSPVGGTVWGLGAKCL
jgi:hypothetical protein